jgi:hypothetical protein
MKPPCWISRLNAEPGMPEAGQDLCRHRLGRRAYAGGRSHTDPDYRTALGLGCATVRPRGGGHPSDNPSLIVGARPRCRPARGSSARCSPGTASAYELVTAGEIEVVEQGCRERSANKTTYDVLDLLREAGALVGDHVLVLRPMRPA